MEFLLPVLGGALYALCMGLIREPHRRRFNAIMVVGAGAAYLSGGGFGGWELLGTAVITYVGYRGLESWTFIGIAWLLHTAWDLLHHLKGNPILPFAHDSALGCALCDPVIALWCFRGGPSLVGFLRNGPAARRRIAEQLPPA
ncbi:membrane protein [Streptomyces platensis subsp. clarensis]|nr:membrane protein [Streptomyces platensis subsp. clarensis]